MTWAIHESRRCEQFDGNSLDAFKVQIVKHAQADESCRPAVPVIIRLEMRHDIVCILDRYQIPLPLLANVAINQLCKAIQCTLSSVNRPEVVWAGVYLLK